MDLKFSNLEFVLKVFGMFKFVSVYVLFIFKVHSNNFILKRGNEKIKFLFKKLPKMVASLVLAVSLFLSGTVISFAQEPINEPAFKPADKSQIGELVNKTRNVQKDGNFTIIETTETYKYKIQTRGETKYFKQTYFEIQNMNIRYATVYLDADFYVDINNIRCPRYYSSYDIVEPSLEELKEVNMTRSYTGEGTRYAKYKITCKYSWKFGPTGREQSKSQSISCSTNG